MPVPLKTNCGRQECVNALTAAFHGPSAGVGPVEAVLEDLFRNAAGRGTIEARLLGSAVPMVPAARPAAPA